MNLARGEDDRGGCENCCALWSSYEDVEDITEGAVYEGLSDPCGGLVLALRRGKVGDVEPAANRGLVAAGRQERGIPGGIEAERAGLEALLGPAVRFVEEEGDGRVLCSASVPLGDLDRGFRDLPFRRELDREVVAGHAAARLPVEIDSLLVVERIDAGHVPQNVVLQEPVHPRAGPD